MAEDGTAADGTAEDSTAAASGEPASIDTVRLRRLLGAPELQWLVDRIAERIAAGMPVVEGTVALADPDPGQRRAAERLLGRAPGHGRSLTIRLRDVDAVLKESEMSPNGLRAAIHVLRGPITVRHEAEAASSRAWESAHEPLAGLTEHRPDLAPWLDRVRTSGLLKRQADGASAGSALAAQAARVLSVLPHPGIVRPVLAARTAGDAHALDDGRPLTALVLSAIRALAGLSATDTADAEGRRAAWAAVGVAPDDLSSRVLVLNVPPPPGEDGTLARLLTAAANAGEPLVLTLRMLDSWSDPPADDPPHRIGDLAGVTVSVCENPAVVAAAATELGPSCPPLICLEGTPSVAANRLLRQVATRCANVRYHGDFDWGGVRIAAGVFDLVDRTGSSAVPWRYDSVAYLRAVARGLGTPLSSSRARDTPWDPELRRHLQAHAVRVEEEQVIDVLLADLAHGTDHGTDPAGLP
ncbi:TIGR02679 family protein [Catenulispora sp. NL8]|uniref:TIGR02679 family protein n=1 Tax=Catenulispora pinistramenti TaxID=2705254 RepID=A0ABS5KIP9_9ACTN|nr:TIGR02679 family protein [Catenulispora pinistramenti]MBS2546271.1 TIGR02679 family protein [Catenulispora pinistramenti]